MARTAIHCHSDPDCEDDARSGETRHSSSAHQQITHLNKRGFDFNMSSEADKIAQFQSITGAPESTARSFLESTHWDLQVHSPSFVDFILTFLDCRRKLL